LDTMLGWMTTRCRTKRMLKKVARFTRPTQARRDALTPRHRSRLIDILNVPRLENKLSWHAS
jgi:hypothetical protein